MHMEYGKHLSNMETWLYFCIFFCVIMLRYCLRYVEAEPLCLLTETSFFKTINQCYCYSCSSLTSSSVTISDQPYCTHVSRVSVEKNVSDCGWPLTKLASEQSHNWPFLLEKVSVFCFTSLQCRFASSWVFVTVVFLCGCFVSHS